MKQVTLMSLMKCFATIMLLSCLNMFAQTDPPTANDDTAETTVNSSALIDVLSNDLGNNLSITITANPSNGVAGLSADNIVVYTPNSGFTGVDVFTYQIMDSSTGLVDEATVSVSVGDIFIGPDAPIAADDNISSEPGVMVTILVLINDIGSNLTVDLVSLPMNGAAIVNQDGEIEYTPNEGFVGSDSFDYEITDSNSGLSSQATVTVSVSSGVVVVLTANNDAASTNANTPVSISVLANDIGGGISIVPESITGASSNGGTVVLNLDNTITYTPAPGFVGTDGFTYTITNGEGNFSDAQVSIIVTEISVANLPPNLALLYGCTEPMTPITFCHSFTDPNGDSVAIDPEETHTTFDCGLAFINDTCFRYTPLPGFTGTDTVHIVVCDDQVPSLCSTSTAVVHIGCVAPIAEEDNVLINSDAYIVNGTVVSSSSALEGAFLEVTLNDLDPCGSDLFATQISSPPSNGVASIVGGQINYDANEGFSGTDVLSYITCNGCALCDTTTVNITVDLGVAPCNTDIAECISPFTSLELCPEFCDIDEIETIEASAAVGFVEQSGENCFSFIPPAEFESVVEITFTACDAMGNCSTTLATITIDPACGENPPVAVNDAATLEPGESVIISVLDNDFDPEGQVLTITEITQQPVCGGAAIIANEIVYSADVSCSGTDMIEYVVCDPAGLCDTAIIDINVEVVEGCTFQTEYCTAPLTGVDICVEFCSLAGSDTTYIADANTTFNCSLNMLTNLCIEYIPLPGYVGTDTVELVGMNELGESEIVTVLVHIDCTDPIAMDDSAIVANPGSVLIPVLENDYDLCGNELAPNVMNNPANGTVLVNDDGTITYTPNPGFAGVDQFEYSACNNCESGILCTPATVTITVTADPIVDENNLQPDIASTLINTPIAINVLANDTGNGLVITSTTLPFYGTVDLDSDGNLVYTPNEDYLGTDYFFYTACDENAECSETVVNVTVLASDSDLPPTANNDLAVTGEDEPVTISVLFNDSDPENGELTVTSVTIDPSNGTATVNDDGTITYVPNPTFIGEDMFTYEVCDEIGNCAIAVVGISVGGEPNSNNPPDAENDIAEGSASEPIIIDVLANDVDPDAGQMLSITFTTIPLYGEVTVNDDNTVTYTPDETATGLDYFEYVVCDNGSPSLCDTAYVVFIGQVDSNLAPIANNDLINTPINTVANIIATVNDDPTDDSLDEHTLTIVEDPVNGTVTVNGLTVEYTPDEDFIGMDSLVYSLCDDSGACDEATIVINVVPGVDAEPDLVSTLVNTMVDISVLDNDFGIEIFVSEVLVLPQHGSIEEADALTGFFTYLPDSNYVGEDYFIYQICDSVGTCDSTIVSISILPGDTENLNPEANNDIASTILGSPVIIPVLNNDSDPLGDPISVTEIFEEPEFGTVVINEDGTVTYTPNEDAPTDPFVDFFTYIVCDTLAACDTAQVAVSVGDTTTNLPPLAFDDVASTSETTPVEIYVLANGDFDPDGIIETIALGSDPINGEVVSIEEGFVYVPDNGFIGIDYFTYIICDNGMPILCDTAFVTIDVLPQGLDAEPDIAYTLANEAIDIPVLANDSGTEIEVSSIITSPENGTVTIDPTQETIEYVPNEDFVGVDYFEYQICDIAENCEITLVTVYVVDTAVLTNVAPNAVNDMDTTPVNTSVTVDVLANDNDPFGGDTLTIQDFTQPENGVVMLNDDGTFTYLPAEDFVGTDVFNYTICDNGDPVICDDAQVVINVGIGSYPNQFPLAVDDSEVIPMNTPISIGVLDNDTDPDSDPLSIVLITDPANGTISFEEGSQFITYEPNEGFIGIDFFEYVICDDGIPTLCDTAYVTVSIIDTFETDFVQINEETIEEVSITMCLEDYIADFIVDTVEVTITPDNGALIIIEDCVQYIPNPDYVGIDSTTLVVCDENEQCIDVLIIIDVIPLSDAPIAVNDTVTTGVNIPIDIAVLDNDSDPDGDDITAIILAGDGPYVEGATVEINPVDQVVIYTPATDFMGTDSFNYIITDAVGMVSDTAWVFVTVTEDAPLPIIQANNDAGTTAVDISLNIEILSNDLIPEDPTLAETLTVTILEDPSNGSVILNSDNTVDYTPNLGFVGVDTFYYNICVTDELGEEFCDDAMVVITIIDEDCAELVFANAFSPNGDGLNESFLIEGLESLCYNETEFTLQIFNRWGDVVHRIEDYSNDKAWNGTWQKNGEMVPDGTYFYLLWGMTPSDEESDYSGFIEIYR